MNAGAASAGMKQNCNALLGAGRCKRSRYKLALMAMVLLSAFLFAPRALAQGPTPPGVSGDAASKFLAITQLVLDTLQGKTTVGADALFAQAQQSVQGLLNNSSADWFFLDFGNPSLPLNQFAATLARNLLLLTPLYALGYLVLFVYNIWRERAIPNPLVYAVLVAGVMAFLAAFALITQGFSAAGRALALALGSSGNALDARATMLDTVIRILVALQKNGGVVAALALIAAAIETTIILIQLVYRGLTMAIWRLLSVLLIPLSVLVEGAQPKTAGNVISGFFEAWLDMVGKITLLLIVLSVASAEAWARYVWIVLPAGLLIVVVSWKFFGLLYGLIRDAVARAWQHVASANENASSELPPAAEAARAKEIDDARRNLLE